MKRWFLGASQVLVGLLVFVEAALWAGHFAVAGLRPSRVPEAPAKIRILTIGESTTSGVSLDDKDSYPSILEKRLRRIYGPRIQVVNVAEPGVTTNYIAHHIEGWIQGLKPALVITMMGINDQFFHSRVYQPGFWNKFSATAQRARVIRLLFSLLYSPPEQGVHEPDKELRLTIKRPRVMQSTVHNYTRIIRAIQNKGIPVIAMQYPLTPKGHLQSVLSWDRDIPIVENVKNFEAGMAAFGYDYYFGDRFAGTFGHCTRAGNELIVDNLLPVVLENLPSTSN